MPNKNTILLLLYLSFSLINLWAGYSYNNILTFYSKPLLMPILALWFYIQTKDHPSLFRQLILIALFFSWGGDTLLMFVESKGEHFFLFGLVSFLVTHTLYAVAFFKTVSWKNGFLWKNKWIVIPFLIFFLGFQNYLLPDVEEAMQIPVTVYSCVIIVMVLAALNWNTFVESKAFQFVFLGALLFMFSDSIIALNKFKSTVPQAHIWIMSLYLLGQYLIVRGGIEMMKKKNSIKCPAF
ncbi:MAG: lysoplasmalogenase [Saprospiraceae bacterium]